MHVVLAIFCTFATESDFPKRKTFWKFEDEKLSKTENLPTRREPTSLLERPSERMVTKDNLSQSRKQF